ncbi:MAG: hypothetical protein WA919_30015 [Coleofasciculaceae cyanobacterium]
MNKLIRLTIKAAVATALISSVTACRSFPLPGLDQDDNVVESVPQSVEQSASQTPIQSASQPSTAQTQDNNEQTTAQAPSTAEAGNDTTATETAESDSNQPVRALW